MSDRLQDIRDAAAMAGPNVENAYADRAWLLHRLDEVEAYAEECRRLLRMMLTMCQELPDSVWDNGVHHDGVSEGAALAHGVMAHASAYLAQGCHEIGTGTNQRQGADSPASASISPSTECLSPAQASSPCLPSDVSLPGAQSAPATPSCDSVRAAAERMVLTFRDWMAGCDNGTRWKEVEAAHINLRDALANPVHAVVHGFPNAEQRRYLIELLRAAKCPEPRCTDGSIISTGPDPQNDAFEWCYQRHVTIEALQEGHSQDSPQDRGDPANGDPMTWLRKIVVDWMAGGFTSPGASSALHLAAYHFGLLDSPEEWARKTGHAQCHPQEPKP